MEETLNYKNIGLTIKEERERLGFTREKFSEIVGISVAYLVHIERGQRKLSLDILARISQELNVPLDYLVYSKDVHTGSIEQIITLLNNISSKDLKAVQDIIKTITPYLKR